MKQTLETRSSSRLGGTSTSNGVIVAEATALAAYKDKFIKNISSKHTVESKPRKNKNLITSKHAQVKLSPTHTDI